jgi:hypothetical protein
VMCGLGRVLQVSEDGGSFEVQFGKLSSGFVEIPEGWRMGANCCVAGCCQ